MALVTSRNATNIAIVISSVGVRVVINHYTLQVLFGVSMLMVVVFVVHKVVVLVAHMVALLVLNYASYFDSLTKETIPSIPVTFILIAS